MPEKSQLVRLLLPLIFACGLFTLLLGATNTPSDETVVIVVRHAEKSAAPSDDPPLSDAGRKRADALSRALSKAGVKAIFATQYQRTQQTVEPTAQALQIPVTKVDAANTPALVAQVLEKHRGQVVLIAGHSNTIPEIIAALGGGPIPAIAETDFDNLFIVSIPVTGPARLLHLKYGAAN